MDIMKLAGTLLSSDSIGGVSERTGSSGNDVSKVLTKALPLLLDGANNQAKGKSTSKGFASALSDHAKDDTSNLSKFLGNVDMEDGAKILGHLLGSGEDDTVKDVAEDTGVSKTDTAAILSAAAPLLLSLLGQQTEEEDKKEAVGDLIGVLLDNVDVGSILTGLLTDKSSDSKGSTKKTSSGSTKKTSSAKKSSSSSSTKKTTTKKTTTKKAASSKTSTKKTSSAKKKAASDNSGADLVTGILKSLLK